MTGYTVHTGSTKKFATNWDEIFKAKAGGKAKSATEQSTAKKSPKSSAKKSSKSK